MRYPDGRWSGARELAVHRARVTLAAGHRGLVERGGLGCERLAASDHVPEPFGRARRFWYQRGSLGVALVMLLYGGSVVAGSFSLTGSIAILLAAFAGAMAVTAIILFFSTLVHSRTMLLIVGIMVGYLSSSVISLLNFFATQEGVKSYLVWGMGHFGGVSMEQLPLFSVLILLGLGCSMLQAKPLNVLLLGDAYAENLGVRTVTVRRRLLAVTGLLTAVVTAYCGPVAFIGLAVPHVARLLLCTDDHHRLLPATILAGAGVALACNVVCFLPGEGGMIPLNAVTPLIGAPVVIYVITRKR